MKRKEGFTVHEFTLENIRLRSTERECPACDAVLLLNETEQCFECLKCGYIDCGEEDYSRGAIGLTG